jgi:hypothetical protein
MSKPTSLASASADPGIEPDVPTAAEIVIDSNMVNVHGEEENTKYISSSRCHDTSYFITI